MAKALMDYAQLHSIDPNPEAVVEFHNYPGEGIHGKLDNRDIYIGNRRISQRAQCETVEIEDGASGGKTRGYIICNGILAGWFSLTDSCRSGAVQAVKELKSMNILTVMLTGDSHAAAAQAQKQLRNAIQVVHAELLPEDKARIIKECEGPVAMLGDGINDAPALATAHVGISMGISGSALATETGNVILMSNDIRKVPKVIRLARRAYNKVIQNLILSLGIKGGILALAIAGHPLVWAAVLADVGTCLLVIFNSMLLLGGIRRKNSGPPKCLKDPQQVFKLPDLDIESQTLDRNIEKGLSVAEENTFSSGTCGKICCSKATDEARTGFGEVALGMMDSSIAEEATMYGDETLKSEIPQGRKNCLKECYSIERDKSTNPEISLGIADSAAISSRSMEIKDSKKCTKGCCSIKNEISCAASVAKSDLLAVKSAKNDAQENLENVVTPAQSTSCKKGCCGSNKIGNSISGLSKTETGSNAGQFNTKVGQGCSENFETPAGIKSCTKGCCGTIKRDNSVAVSSESGSISQESMEKIASATHVKNCKKGCCGSNKKDCAIKGSSIVEIDSGVSDIATKLDQGSFEKIETPACSKSCAKGCCGSNKKYNSAPGSPITETGSFNQEKIESPAYRKSCTKACCGSNKRDNPVTRSLIAVTNLSVGENTAKLDKESWEKLETPAPIKSCSKGCCGSNKKDNSVTKSRMTETGSSLVDHNTLLDHETLDENQTSNKQPSMGCSKGCCGSKAAKPETPVNVVADESLETEQNHLKLKT